MMGRQTAEQPGSRCHLSTDRPFREHMRLKAFFGVGLPLALLMAGSTAIAECLPDDEGDVKLRVQSRMRETFVSSCRGMPASNLKFHYFASFMSDKSSLTAEQHFDIEGSRQQQKICLAAFRTKLQADARSSAGPNCSLYRIYRAGWFPNADGGPAVMFYMKRK